MALKKGQSVHHILATQRDSFTICEKTVYRYVNAGVIRTKRGDMPRACMMRPRKSKNIDHKVDTKCRIGRTFSDFKHFCNSNPETAIVEMDSVAGRVGGKVLLTLQFNSCGFMLAFIREANNSQSVIDIFNLTSERKLSNSLFVRLNARFSTLNVHLLLQTCVYFVNSPLTIKGKEIIFSIKAVKTF